jgi:hypothetical protein
MMNSRYYISKLEKLAYLNANIDNIVSMANCGWEPLDKRIAAVRWLHREHALATEAGDTSPLDAFWTRLVVRPGDPLQLAAVKAKAVASCIEAGVADWRTALYAFGSWHGFGGIRASSSQRLCRSYCLRVLNQAVSRMESAWGVINEKKFTSQMPGGPAMSDDLIPAFHG